MWISTDNGSECQVSLENHSLACINAEEHACALSRFDDPRRIDWSAESKWSTSQIVTCIALAGLTAASLLITGLACFSVLPATLPLASKIFVLAVLASPAIYGAFALAMHILNVQNAMTRDQILHAIFQRREDGFQRNRQVT